MKRLCIYVTYDFENIVDDSPMLTKFIIGKI